MRFRCKVLETDGSAGSVLLEARDEQGLYEDLRGRGLLLLDAVQDKAVQDKATARRSSDVFGDKVAHERSNASLSTKKLLAFTQSMATAMMAGVPVLSTLQAIAAQGGSDKSISIVQGICTAVSRGNTLANSLARYPRVFPDIYVSMVRSGEESACLEAVFTSLAELIEWQEELKKTALHAAIYPAVVLSAAYGMILFLLAFVIPRLGDILHKVVNDLPLPSRMLLDVSGVVAEYVWYVIAGSILVLIGTIAALRTKRGVSICVSLAVKLPGIRGIIQNLNRSQLCKSMHLLLASGLTISRSLDLAGNGLSLQSMKSAVFAARREMIAGSCVTKAFEEQGILPPLGNGILKVGEEAGSLPICFEQLGRSYQRDAQGAVKNSIAFLEPAITVLLGVVVGGIAAIVITTLYSALGGLSR